jgi:hypothetical protein
MVAELYEFRGRSERRGRSGRGVEAWGCGKVERSTAHPCGLPDCWRGRSSADSRRATVTFGTTAEKKNKGRIVWQGKAADVDDSGNPYVEQFIHGSAQGPIQMEVLRP